ncbi:glycosyltransferase family 61 protein [Paenibacillus xerothermodurans]|uniref:Glycosyltransferase family 61 protein n=1 Tax=Paenibacillus xerothermodurans TaxID=1977292 RepID=A0A2W1NS84_PAEXE|nr:glycosyltransferase family 61 protein [Paenibacillus xerothermodurans]PZE20616.1 glycosyltransferase family 61 protein [Paenibacillus xerothermodurans]
MAAEYDRNRQKAPDHYFCHTREWARQSGLNMYTTYIPLCVESRHPVFVAVIPDGRVWGDSGTVITPDNYLLWDVSYHWTEDPLLHPVFREAALPEVRHVPGSLAVLNTVGSANYYHWMYDVLPRILLLRMSGVHVDTYLIGCNPRPFQLETLAAFGISPHHVVPSEPFLHIQADRLIVPALRRGERWAYSCLRNTFARFHHGTTAARRIYISRAGVGWRTVVNEAQVASLLSSCGFETVYPEAMPVREQVRLFSSAQMVISSTGSALTNLTFSKRGTKVLEFFSPHFLPSEIKQICLYGGLRHWSMICKAVRPRAFADSSNYWPGCDNVEVNLSELSHLLQQMGVKTQP